MGRKCILSFLFTTTLSKILNIDDSSFQINNTEMMSNMIGALGTRHLHALRSMAMFMHPDFDGIAQNNKGKLVNKNAGLRWKELKRYGCWCWVNGKIDGKTLTQGTGKPVDEIDSACKRLFQCYQCANSDFGETCDYVSTRYDKSQEIDTITGEKSITCNEDENTCERSLCECDRQFAVEYGVAVNSGKWNSEFHQEYSTDNNWDPYNKDNCKNDGVREEGDKKCCGNYPFRFPMVENANRNCCEGAGKSYDPNMHECCNDEVVAWGSCA